MSDNKNTRPTEKMWVRVLCGVLGGLMVAGTVVMLIQILMG